MLSTASTSFAACSKAENDSPNIVIIYADDMGYGGLNCQNPNSKIPTPNLDIMATLASITGAVLTEKMAPDSYNFLPVLKGEKYKSPIREATIHNTFESKWGVRKGDWLYINSSSGGHRELPESFKKLLGYTDFHTEGLLFNMKDDPEQRVNLYQKYPEKIIEMDKLLQENREKGYSIR